MLHEINKVVAEVTSKNLVCGRRTGGGGGGMSVMMMEKTQMMTFLTTCKIKCLFSLCCANIIGLEQMCSLLWFKIMF